MPALGPLSGIVVIDLTRGLAGPFCTLMLADLGARVIKVEDPAIGDLSRHVGPWFSGKSGYMMSVNRGKESIALNLKAPVDLEIFHQLLEKADVLCENFRPGVMERLGLGWEALHARYPKLIYAATSGFGHTGPYAQYPAYDVVAQGMGGIMSLTGHPGSSPTRVGTSIGDIGAGLFTAIGVNAALFHRARTGEGMKIDVAMLDCQVAITENAIVRYYAGDNPGPIGARHPTIAPFDAFQAKDRHFIMAVAGDDAYHTLCKTIGRDDLATDARFATNELRVQNQRALKDELLKTLATKTAAEWIDLLHEAGVPCGPINKIEDVVKDPHVAARNMIIEVEDPTAGRVKMFGNPIKMSGFDDPHERAPAPDLDQDRAKILEELKGED
jgi:CoA:oxalate CoA-transferase